MAEYTWSPHWFASIIDQYNFGNPDESARVHNTCTPLSDALTGRIDCPSDTENAGEGIFCIGGVCRAVPASNGFEVNFSSSF